MIWKQKSTIRQRDFDGAVVLIDPDHALLHELNGVGSRIWSLCDGERDLDTIVETLVEEFEVSASEARDDVTTFAQRLSQMGLLVTDASQAAQRERL